MTRNTLALVNRKTENLELNVNLTSLIVPLIKFNAPTKAGANLTSIKGGRIKIENVSACWILLELLRLTVKIRKTQAVSSKVIKSKVYFNRKNK